MEVGSEGAELEEVLELPLEEAEVLELPLEEAEVLELPLVVVLCEVLGWMGCVAVLEIAGWC